MENVADHMGFNELDDNAFLALLEGKGVQIRAVAGELRISALAQTLDAATKEEIKRRKSALIQILGQDSGRVDDLRKKDLGVRARRRLSPAGQWTPQIQYWRSQLDGVPGILELPFSKLRNAPGSIKTERIPLSIPPPLEQSLRKVATEAGVSFERVLLAGFALLICRYTDKVDFCIGLPVLRKQRKSDLLHETVVENVLALRCRVNHRSNVYEFLRLIQERSDEAAANSGVPFTRLLDVLPIETLEGANPFFQILCGLDVSRKEECFAPDTDNDADFPYDLAFFVDSKSETELSGHFRYKAELFSQQSIGLFSQSFITLLNSMACNPELHVSELSVLSDTLKHQLLVEWNQTDLDFPPLTIHRLFEVAAEQFPDSQAIATQSESITYSELNQRANQLARFLLKRDIPSGACIGIFMRRNVEMIVSMLAVLKAGFAYLPLDPTYPAQRLEAMLEESRAALVLADIPVREAMLINERDVARVDIDASDIQQMSVENPTTDTGIHDLAYVLYTSGSTGRPKGIAVEHHSTVSLLSWARSQFKPEELQRVFAATSICFDLSVFEIFLPLISGGTVVLAADVLELAQLGETMRPTLINTVPSALSTYMLSMKIPESVRCVNLAGEPLPETLVRQIEEQVPQARIFDLYGPTETTTYSTFTQRRSGESSSIGRPLANTKIFILDERNQPVPPEVPGQIFIGGEGVARGYLYQPELTNERFVRFTHLSYSGRLYATGDLARYTPEGNIVYLGRMDQQIKIRGFRVELGEVEKTLQQHPRINDVAVLLHKDEGLGGALVAYVTIASGPIDQEELVSFQQKLLPPYMVAREIVLLESLPKTLNGKIDRKALKSMRLSAIPQSAKVSSALSPTEQRLTEIWEKNFRRAPIGIDDDFFALGGHSLLAFQIFSDIEKQLSKQLALSILFKAPTIRSLASEIER